ncbi:hypothetical protein BGW80DRAFT_1348357 [Lactifluus volemus]|nr:hypothetical protein BGW80DRAFT_1348357 [Lactifluus volemus]
MAIKTVRLDASKPIPALCAFQYPELKPLYFKLSFADDGASFVSASITYDHKVIPGEGVHVQVKLHSFAHHPSRRIASISLRIKVPDNKISNVEPATRFSDEGPMEVTGTETSEVRRIVTGRLNTFVDASAEGQNHKSITRSATETNRQVIQGILEGRDAFWSIKEADGATGGKGIRGSMDLSFILEMQPRRFLYDLYVVDDMNGTQTPYVLRSGRGFWSGRFWYFQK